MNKTNPHFRSRYADLSAVRDGVIPIFNKHGLALTQAPTISDEYGFHLETRVMHQTGEELVWRFPLPADFTKPQAIGSAISYARRYTLASIAAVASEEDDDGNAAQNSNGGGHSAGGGPRGGTHAISSPASAGGGIEL